MSSLMSRARSGLAQALCRIILRLDRQALIAAAAALELAALWQRLSDNQRAAVLENIAAEAAELGWRVSRDG